MCPSLRRSARLALAILPALLALAVTALPLRAAEPTRLTLDEALSRAVERSQLARSARAGALGAAEMARAAGELPDPMVSAGVDNLPVTGRDALRPWAEDMTMKRIAIAQEWVAADKRAARSALAQAQAQRERQMEPVAAAEARLQTALAFLDGLYAQQAVAIARHALAHAQEESQVAQARLASSGAMGSGSGVTAAEVLALQGMAGQAEDELAEMQQQAAAAEVALRRWVGGSATDAGEPGTQLAPVDLGAVPEEEAYVARSATVLARQRDLAVAQREAELAGLARRPTPTFELSYGQRQSRADLISFSVSLPLPVAPDTRQDRETAAKLAMADRARAELAEAERVARAEHAALRSDADRLAQRLARYPAAVQAPLAQRSAATLAAYRSNTASLAMVFEARHAELEAERRLLALRRDLDKARAQLIFKPLAADVPAAGVQP
ncbi:MAG: hypothetical protein RL722_1231 [Pseudomonadota bacterium]|jgi:outer membrane protein TolC